MTDKQALRKLIEAVEGSDLSKVNQRLADMYSDLGDEWPWDWMSMVNSAYKGYLDAAKALHEALLSELTWEITPKGNVYIRDADYCCVSLVLDHKPTARAWLLAILRAYEAQQ